MRLRLFSFVRLTFLALVLTFSLVLGGCDGDNGVGDEDNVEGIIGENGVGEEGELDEDNEEGEGLLDEEEDD